MATIGTFTLADGAYSGAIKTLTLNTDAECSDLKPKDRARIQLIYVPASRDGISQVTAFLRGRLWRAINWSEGTRTTFASAGSALNNAFSGEPAVDAVVAAVTKRWQQVHTAGTDTTPVFRPIDLRFEQFIRKAEVLFRPDEAGRERGLDELSDGQRSLFHLAMTAATLDVEANLARNPHSDGFQPGGVSVPALTLIAVEEPENNLAPFYLSRIVRQIQELTAGSQAQAMLSSHSPSILARVQTLSRRGAARRGVRRRRQSRPLRYQPGHPSALVSIPLLGARQTRHPCSGSQRSRQSDPRCGGSGRTEGLARLRRGPARSSAAAAAAARAHDPDRFADDMTLRFIAPDEWRPRGIDALEPAAWTALRHPASTSVVAGPGAGKTEFLAQKATYLLETGLCRPPFQILAISFKGDAAGNLADRVRQRCPAEFSDRFTSITFDAFTKNLVDRFHTAIPAEWRPTKPYEIAFWDYKSTNYWLTRARLAAPDPWKAEIEEIGPSSFEGRTVGARRMLVPHPEPQSGADFATARWWSEQRGAGDPSNLTFVTLNRMAELLLRSNPQIANALRATYPFIFVDEFQDTTFAQYDFLHSVFGGSSSVITGVGDDKQRIMGWAGARPDAFARLEADFHALRVPLQFNFRSSPDLVAIQHVVARALDPASPQVQAKAGKLIDGDVAQIWNSPTRGQETGHLATWMADDMTRRGRRPRDYAILVKQKAEVFDTELRAPMAASGLRIRNESALVGKVALQDLLSDSLCRLVIAALRLGSVQRSPAAWQYLSAAVSALRAIPPGDSAADARAEAALSRFLVGLRKEMTETPPSAVAAVNVAEAVLTFLDPAAVQRTYVEYGTGNLLEIIVEGLSPSPH